MAPSFSQPGQLRGGHKEDLLKYFPSTSAHIAPQPVVDAVIIDGKSNEGKI